MKRRLLLTTAILALFFGFGSLKPSSKASDQQTSRPRKVVTAIAEDFQGSSKIVYFSEDENGARAPLAEGEVSTEGAFNIMSAQTAQVTGVKKLAVILTNFTDDQRQPLTVAEVREAVFGTGPDSLVNRFARNSYGQLTLVGRVFGWVTVTPPVDQAGKPYAGCDRGYFANQAARQAAGAVGFDNYMLFVPSEADCNFGGIADIIGTRSTLFGYFDLRSAVHELGHNFGLLHGSYINYNGSQPISKASCFESSDSPTCEYGDVTDPMGKGQDLFHSFNKIKLGWIPPTDAVTVDAANHDQFITLVAGEQFFGTRDIAIPLNDGSGYSYHIEYRCCDLDPEVRGVLVHLGKPDSPTDIFYTYLVPGQQGNPADAETAALKLPGQVYLDPTHQVRIELLGINGTQAVVHVTVPAAPPPHISDVSYNGGKKLTIFGENFGQAAELFINGVNISNSVNWLARSDGRLKLKASPSVLGFHAGQNSVQVMTASGSAMSNVFVVTL